MTQRASSSAMSMGPPPPRNPEGWKGAGDTGKLARSASGKTDALPRLARVAVDCSALQKEVNSLQDHLCQSSASGKGAMDFALLQNSLAPVFDARTYHEFDTAIFKALGGKLHIRSSPLQRAKGLGMDGFVERIEHQMAALRKQRDDLVRDNASVWRAKREELQESIADEDFKWRKENASRKAAKQQELDDDRERRVAEERKWYHKVRKEQHKHADHWMKEHMTREQEIFKAAETEERRRNEDLKDRAERFQAEIGLTRALHKYADLNNRKADAEAGKADAKEPSLSELTRITEDFERAMKSARELGMSDVCDKIEQDFTRQKMREESKDKFKAVDQDRNRELQAHLRRTVESWETMKNKQIEEWDKLRGNVATTDYLKRKLKKLTDIKMHDAESVRILAETVKEAQNFGAGSLPEIERAQQILHEEQKEVLLREENLTFKLQKKADEKAKAAKAGVLKTKEALKHGHDLSKHRRKEHTAQHDAVLRENELATNNMKEMVKVMSEMEKGKQTVNVMMTIGTADQLRKAIEEVEQLRPVGKAEKKLHPWAEKRDHTAELYYLSGLADDIEVAKLEVGRKRERENLAAERESRKDEWAQSTSELYARVANKSMSFEMPDWAFTSDEEYFSRQQIKAVENINRIIGDVEATVLSNNESVDMNASQTWPGREETAQSTPWKGAGDSAVKRDKSKKGVSQLLYELDRALIAAQYLGLEQDFNRGAEIREKLLDEEQAIRDAAHNKIKGRRDEEQKIKDDIEKKCKHSYGEFAKHRRAREKEASDKHDETILHNEKKADQYKTDMERRDELELLQQKLYSYMLDDAQSPEDLTVFIENCRSLGMNQNDLRVANRVVELKVSRRKMQAQEEEFQERWQAARDEQLQRRAESDAVSSRLEGLRKAIHIATADHDIEGLARAIKAAEADEYTRNPEDMKGIDFAKRVLERFRQRVADKEREERERRLRKLGLDPDDEDEA